MSFAQEIKDELALIRAQMLLDRAQRHRERGERLRVLRALQDADKRLERLEAIMDAAMREGEAAA